MSIYPFDPRCRNCQRLGLPECASPAISSNTKSHWPRGKNSQVGRKGRNALHLGTQQDTSPLSSFWTGDSPRRRSGSVHSLSSSRNSSLHGYPTFDPEEQDPVFMKGSQRSASTDFGTTSPGLPPPPIELDQTQSFNCDICGSTIRVKRRLEWQYVSLELLVFC